MLFFERTAHPVAVQNEAQMRACYAESFCGLGHGESRFLFTSRGVSRNNHGSGFNPKKLMVQQQNNIITRNFCRALLQARGDRPESWPSRKEKRQ